MESVILLGLMGVGYLMNKDKNNINKTYEEVNPPIYAGSGNSIYDQANYSDAKKLASQVNNRPTVLSGALHKDVWYLPSGTSPEAQFLRDANANYLWSETTANGSLALSFETVFKKAKDADLWISPSYYSSLKALESANTHYTQFKAFKNKKSIMAMTSHIIYKDLDKINTATHSKIVIKMIRDKIKFKNIIITDDISMKALKTNLKNSVIKSFTAGCNLVLHCNGSMREMNIVAKNSPKINSFIRKKTSEFYKILS